MTFAKWLDAYVDEKGLNRDQILTVPGPSGPNYIPLEVLLEHIKQAPPSEQAGIKTVMVKIDFANRPVMHFFQHLAGAIAR